MSLDLYPGAIWRPSVISHPTRSETRGLCIHNTYGHLDGDVETLDGPTVDSHWYVTKTGRVYQFLDPDSMSWTAMHTANSTCLHIEHEGTREEPWTPEQMRSSAALVGWACRRYRIPVRHVNPPAEWAGLFDHRDLSGFEGNDHGDGVPPSSPGWDAYLAAIREAMRDADPERRTLAQRLGDAGMGPASTKAILRVLGHLPPGYTGTPTPQDSDFFRRLRSRGGLGPDSARQVVYARRFLLSN